MNSKLHPTVIQVIPRIAMRSIQVIIQVILRVMKKQHRRNARSPVRTKSAWTARIRRGALPL